MARAVATRSSRTTKKTATTRTTSRTKKATKAAKTTKATKATKPTKAAAKTATKTTTKATAKKTPSPVKTASKRVAATPVKGGIANRPAPRANSAPDDLEPIWVAYKSTKDTNLRNILIERHIGLVRTIAERLLQTLPKSIELDDLTSAGTFGLMDAIDGFDLARGIKFKTYCTTRIRGSILDELRSQDWVPRLVRLKAHRLEKALRQLEGELGRDPNEFELAEAMGMTLTELQATEQEANAKTIFSLSEKWDDGDDDKEMEKVEILADKKGQDPLLNIHQKDLLDVITRNLTKKERLIVIMYYYEGLTMREIGEIMQLTESRVCQIHSNVISRLKERISRRSQTMM